MIGMVSSIVVSNLIYLLQLASVKFSPVTQVPLNLVGTGPNPSSLKLSDSGHTPVNGSVKFDDYPIGLEWIMHH